MEVLAALGGDGAIVYLGRCAERHPALAGIVNGVLRDMESGWAERLAGCLEAGGWVSASAGDWPTVFYWRFRGRRRAGDIAPYWSVQRAVPLATSLDCRLLNRVMAYMLAIHGAEDRC